MSPICFSIGNYEHLVSFKRSALLTFFVFPQETVMPIVSYFCVFFLLSSFMARANCSSGEVLTFYFLSRFCVAHILKTSCIKIVRDKSLFHERVFCQFCLNYEEASTREIINVISLSVETVEALWSCFSASVVNQSYFKA